MSEQKERNSNIVKKIKELAGMSKEMRPDIVAMINHKDQFDYLDGCLKSLVGRVDEVYIGDMSKDKGKLNELIDKYKKEFAIKVVNIPPSLKSFALMRNLVLEIIPVGKWILLIDADERLEGDIFPLSDIYGGYRIIIESPHVQNNGRIVYERNMVFRIFKKKNQGMRFKNRIHEQIIQNFDQNDVGYITSARLVHLGYDISVEQMREKVERNIRLLQEEIATFEQVDGYLYFHLGEMYSFLREYFPALMAYKKALQLGLKNEEMERRAANKFKYLREIFKVKDEDLKFEEELNSQRIKRSIYEKDTEDRRPE
jgi:hypothetical protein